MSITDIRNKIISGTEKKKKGLEKDLEEKMQEIQKSLTEEKRNSEKLFEKELEKILNENKRKFLSLLNREQKIKKENLKREVVEDVLKKSIQRLDQISDQDFRDFSEKVFQSIPKDMKGCVLIGSEKVALLNDLIKNYPTLSLEEDNSVKSGFLVVGDNFRYDFTFENLLQSKKTELELELSKILFS